MLINWDCLEEMDKLIEQWVKVDCIVTDPPYWTTACKWDTVIPFEKMWERLNKLIKPNGAIVLFGSQPFTSNLIMSNIKMFKHEWIWEKHQGTNPMSAKISPLKSHENILIFGKSKLKYNPQMENGKPYSGFNSDKFQSEVYGGGKSVHRENKEGTRYPKTVIKITKDKGKRFHPTQKPVALMEYLIKTYTNEWETILDFTMWSWTTWVASVNTNREFIWIELDEWYFKIAQERILKHI